MRAKKFVLAGTAFALTLLSGCMENNVFKGEKEEEKTFNTFDYSTVNPATTLEVAYLNTGVKARVYFELYDEMPVIENEYSYSKRPDVTPLFAAYTNTDGVFKDNVQLPAYLKKVYIYTPAFYARTLIEAEVVNGNIQAIDAVEEEAGTRAASTKEEHDSYMVIANPPEKYSDTRWKTWLGDYNKRNGEISYKYEGEELALNNIGKLYTAHTRVINRWKHCPIEYRSNTDLYVEKAAELAVTFLGQNSPWNSSLGYYYYKDGEKPKNLNAANVIMLFPNTQDGYCFWPTPVALTTAGINRRTAVQLKYYPNIATDSKVEGTTTFPAGYRIGFVLANNAWHHRARGWDGNHRYRAATSEGLSVDNAGSPYNAPRTAAYKYDGHVMISFEDYNEDDNFSDVVITMKSNPVNAITDIPVVDPDDEDLTVKALKGIYAFEDMWPAEGDYDMNDVIVRYDYEKTIDENNSITSESFIFTTFQNYAAFANGLAFRVTPLGTVKNTEYYIHRPTESEFTEAKFTEETDGDAKVYLLTEDVRTDMGAEYKVTLEYASPVTEESTTDERISPFIYRASKATTGKRWEVHLPQTQPTSNMDDTFLGEGADASDSSKGIYYVRDGIYPFALFLSGAGDKDVAKLLDPNNESKRIDDDDLYPGYKEWAESNGVNNKDWYKQQ